MKPRLWILLVGGLLLAGGLMHGVLFNESPPNRATTLTVEVLVVDTGALTAIDFSAGRTLMDLQQDLAKQNVVLALTRVSPDLRQDLDALELTGVIGADRIFESRKASLEAYHAQSGTGAAA